jgi:hypothetical protein
MSNKAMKLYREFLRTMKKTTTKNMHASIKRELKYHFQGNSLLQSDTEKDIENGYRIIKIMKENSIYNINNSPHFRQT